MSQRDEEQTVIRRLRDFRTGATSDGEVVAEVTYGEPHNIQTLALRIDDVMLRKFAEALLKAYRLATAKRKRLRN